MKTENWYGVYSVIHSSEPTKCLEEIFDAIRKLTLQRENMGTAIDGTTEIIVKTCIQPNEERPEETVTVGMKWRVEEEKQ